MDLKLKNKVILVSGEDNALAAAICALLTAEDALPVNIKPGDSEAVHEALALALRTFGQIDGLANTGSYPNYLARCCFPLLKKSGGTFVNIMPGDDIQPLYEGVPCYSVDTAQCHSAGTAAAMAVFLLSPVSSGQPEKRAYRKTAATVFSPGHEPPD